MTSSLSIAQNVAQSRETAIKLFTPNVSELFSKIDTTILDQNEMELERHFNRTPIDYALRKRLWELVAAGRPLTVGEWAKGVCDDQHVTRRVFLNPYRTTWIFTPLIHHQEMYDEAFHLLFNKMRDYLSKTTITDENLSDHMALFERIANRAIGPVAKNINVKTQTVPSPALPEIKTVEDIDKRIAELESGSRQPTIIDVDPE
jgi:hypothetical protein